MAQPAVVKNIGRTTEKINGVSVVAGGTTVVDLDVTAVRQQLRNDDDWVVLEAVTAEAAAMLAGEAFSAVFTVGGSEVANARTVGIQLKDLAGVDLAVRSTLFGYLSSDAAGDTLEVSGNFVVTSGADGTLLVASGDDAGVDVVLFPIRSEADGDIDLVVTNPADGAPDVYLHLVLPNGKSVASTIIAFADDTP